MSELQSNSPFSTSNFNPHSPLVRYDVPSLFPTMSPQESRLLWCFLEGDPTPYDIFDIPLSTNVNQLKAMIKEKIESLHEINAYGLRLWKPNVLVPINPDHSLAQRLADLGQTATYSRKLSSAEEVGELFLEPHSRKHLHIVVQCEILAPSGPSASRKRLRCATEEGGRVAKRKETYVKEVSETRNKMGDASDIQTRCVAIHEAIKGMPDLDLSDPSTFTTLPFPSFFPTQRFECKTVNDMDHFEYMGRHPFGELHKRIQDGNFLIGTESLYLYGTSGSGKSHLLAALAYNLVREGRRVFYIPDCSTFLLRPEETMWIAFNFAFYDSNNLGAIRDYRDIDAMIDFMSKYEDLYIIVDQVNALECEDNDNRKAKKSLALNWLDALRFGHRYVFSASANEASNREADRKQSGFSVFRMFGGMSEDETDQWFTHHGLQIPPLSDEQRLLVKYLTGCIPLLLCCLFDLKSFSELEFKNNPTLRKVATDVDIFFRTRCASLNTSSKEMYISIMRNCVRGHLVSIDDRTLYDLRYFYLNERSIGSFTCGIAFETMMSSLRMHDTTQFKDDSWYLAVSQSSNPVVQGFLAEQICLSSIATTGLTAVHPKLGRMSHAFFETHPNFTQFLSTDHETCIYFPTPYNFRVVDAVILFLDRSSKQAIVFPIQFTLTPRDKPSDKDFHTTFWSGWIEPIESAGYSVQSTFVWIDKKQPSEYVEPKLVKSLRSGDKVVHPDYSVIHVGVKMVDQRLASVLGIE